MATLAERTGWRAFGLAPFFPAATRLPAEDAFGLSNVKARNEAPVTIAVPMLSRIANFDDFDPLQARARRAARLRAAGRAAAGRRSRHSAGQQGDDRRPRGFSRAGLADRPHGPCAARREASSGSAAAIRCWGRDVADPEGIEGPAGAVEGLGLLDVETGLTGEKTLQRVEGECVAQRRARSRATRCMSGGRAARTAPALSCASPTGRVDGAVSADGRVAGAYVHGLFADDRQRAAWLASLGAVSELEYETTVERTLDELADHLEAHLDCDAMLDAAQ